MAGRVAGNRQMLLPKGELGISYHSVCEVEVALLSVAVMISARFNYRCSLEAASLEQRNGCQGDTRGSQLSVQIVTSYTSPHGGS